MKYRSVLITRRGPPEVLQVVENDLREPAAGEARIRVLAAGVGLTDVVMRRDFYPFAPRMPFVTGYEIVGVVDAAGPDVRRVRIGECVAALTVHGGCAEYLYLSEEHLVPVPSALDPAEAVCLPLNYITAYQVLHRSARVKAGDRVLITGASGGVGTAFLQLGKLAGLTMYGTASASKHSLLTEYGAFPIDYKTQDFVEVLRQREPHGLDFVFDSVGGDFLQRGFRVLRPGGKLVGLSNQGIKNLLLDLAKAFVLNWLPNRKSAEWYGITPMYRKHRRLFFEDLQNLFQLLEQGRIKPIIAAKLPLLEARKAHELLESGRVSGKIVLLSPELLAK